LSQAITWFATDRNGHRRKSGTPTKRVNKVNNYTKIKKKRNRHQHNTDDGRQTMGEEMRHVQMSR